MVPPSRIAGPGEHDAQAGVIWTEAEGMVSIGKPPGSRVAIALGVSSDGSTVVEISTGPEAFIWDATSGMRLLRDVLVGLGLDLTGWTLESAEDISADGLTIVGNGISPDGLREGWVAVLSEPYSVPAVGGVGRLALFAGMLLAAGLAGPGLRRRAGRFGRARG